MNFSTLSELLMNWSLQYNLCSTSTRLVWARLIILVTARLAARPIEANLLAPLTVGRSAEAIKSCQADNME